MNPDHTYKILHLEDVKTDAELVARELKKVNMKFDQYVVETENDYREALKHYNPDIVLCDHSLASFNSHAALEIFNEQKLNIPFILITATLSDEVAISILKEGADDFILKDRLKRLPVAIENALKKIRIEKEYKIARENLIASEQFANGVFDSLSSHISVINADGLIIKVNKKWNSFATENDADYNEVGEGANYFDACKILSGTDDGTGTKALKGIKDVLGGVVDNFYLEYPCHSPEQQRWFLMRVDKFESTEPLLLIEHQNITQRKISEELTKASEKLLADAQAMAKIGSWETNLENFRVKWSAETFRIFEMDAKTFTPTHQAFLGFIHPEDKHTVEGAFNASLVTGTDHTIQHRITTNSREVKYLEESWHIMRDPAGNAITVIGTTQDITDRKLAEIAKEFEKNNTEALINNTEDLVWSVTSDLKLVAANHSFIKTIAESTGVIIKPGQPVLMREYFTPAVWTFWDQCYYIALSGAILKKEVYTPAIKNRKASWTETTFNPIKDKEQVIGVACFSRNITSSKEAALELEKVYKERNIILESIDDGFFAIDNNSNITYWNKKAEELLHAKKDDVIGKNLHELFANPESMVFHDNYLKAIKENITTHFDAFSKRSNKWFSVSAFASENGLSVYFKDVTESKAFAEKISESEKRYRSLFEQNLAGFYVSNAAGRIISCNMAFARMLKYDSPEEIIQLNATNLYFASKERKRMVQKVISNKNLVNYEGRLKCKDGTAMYFLENVTLNKNEKTGEEYFDGILIDISERKNAELLLKASNDIQKKLESSLLAEQLNKQNEILKATTDAQERERRGIGEELHDNVNQLLVASKLYLSHALKIDEYKPLIEKTQEFVTTAINEIRTISNALVGPEKAEKMGLVNSVTALIKDLRKVKEIKISFKHKGFEEVQVDEGLKVIMYRIIQEQVNNILKHAEASKAEIKIIAMQDHMELSISDNGKGFDMSAKKEGIGLRNIKHRVEAYHGELVISSAPGQGCKIIVSFKHIGA